VILGSPSPGRAADKIENGFDHAFPDWKPRNEPLCCMRSSATHRGFCFDAGVAVVSMRIRRSGSAIGISDIDLHEKAIELGLGQGIGTLLLKRILRSREHERGAADRAVRRRRRRGILHRLEQRRLGSGTRPVDFVGHEQLGKYGSPYKAKTAAAPIDSFFEDFGSRISRAIKSGVNWTRRVSRPRTAPRVSTSLVLARPGTPTSNP